MTRYSPAALQSLELTTVTDMALFRILFCVTLVQSTLIHAKLISGSYAYFALPFITKFPPEIWRLFTSFCVTQGGMAYIMDLYCCMQPAGI